LKGSRWVGGGSSLGSAASGYKLPSQICSSDVLDQMGCAGRGVMHSCCSGSCCSGNPTHSCPTPPQSASPGDYQSGWLSAGLSWCSAAGRGRLHNAHPAATLSPYLSFMCRAEAAQQIRPAQPCSMMLAPLRPQERHTPRACRTAHTSPSTRHSHCALAPASTAGRQAGSNPLQLMRQCLPSTPKGALFLGAAGSSLWCNHAQQHPAMQSPCLTWCCTVGWPVSSPLGQPVPQRLWVQDLLSIQTLVQLLMAVLLCIIVVRSQRLKLPCLSTNRSGQ
jgi:hypothetical protein